VAKGQLRSNREKKPKAERNKKRALQPSRRLRRQGLPGKVPPAGSSHSFRAHRTAARDQRFPERQSRKLIVCSTLGARVRTKGSRCRVGA